MPDPVIPDIVAFSNQRKYTVVDSGFSRNELCSEIVNCLVLAGWVKLSGPTTQTHGEGYTLKSQQSPWYDVENIPPWYVGNKIYLEINNDNSANDIEFYIGALYNDILEHLQTTPFKLRLLELSGFAFNILACPYQCVLYSQNSVVTSTSTQDGNAQFRQMLISAVNLPKAILQLNQVVHCIFATTRLRGHNDDLGGAAFGQDYTCYRTMNDLGSFTDSGLGDDGLRFLTTQSGWDDNVVTGRRIWNPILDPTMEDPDKWSAFFLPPAAIWKLPPNSVTSINGFIWDSFVYSEGFQLDSTILQKLRNWQCFAGYNRTDLSDAGASLWFVIDDINVEES